MPFIQPDVEPLPLGMDLTGQTVIVTGATSGIGLSLSRQLLTLKVSTIVFAVRNIEKGEMLKQSLRTEPTIASANHGANIKVMKLEMEDPDSVQAFATAFLNEFPELHLVMLNAGLSAFKKEMTKTGHEKNIQVNYLSNVLLTFRLLPLMETSASRAGRPGRITWTGSRTHHATSLLKKPLLPHESLLGHFKTLQNISIYARYGDSKLLAVMFQRELAKHYSAEKVIINGFCPGMTATGISEGLPFYMQLPVWLVLKLRARSSEEAAWIGLNAAVIVGVETHGRLLADKKMEE